MPANPIAPVVMFVYNRPQHTEQSIKSLQENTQARDTVLYIYADGAKAGSNNEELQKIAATRLFLKTIVGFKQVIVVEQEKNKGLARSVIDGVTEVVNKHGRVIVMEDDLLVSPFFLEFMNDGLDVYENASQVYSINGFMFPFKHQARDVQLLALYFHLGMGHMAIALEGF